MWELHFVFPRAPSDLESARLAPLEPIRYEGVIESNHLSLTEVRGAPAHALHPNLILLQFGKLVERFLTHSLAHSLSQSWLSQWRKPIDIYIYSGRKLTSRLQASQTRYSSDASYSLPQTVERRMGPNTSSDSLAHHQLFDVWWVFLKSSKSLCGLQILLLILHDQDKSVAS